MNVHAIRAAWASVELGATTAELLVALAIADHANAAGVSWPGRTRLAEQTGLSASTVKRAVGRLRTLGVLETVAGGIGRGKLTRYRLRLAASEKGATVTPFPAEKRAQGRPPFSAEKGSFATVKGVRERTQKPYLNHKGSGRAARPVDNIVEARALRLVESVRRNGDRALVLDDWRTRAVAVRAIALGADPVTLGRHGCDVPVNGDERQHTHDGRGAAASGGAAAEEIPAEWSAGCDARTGAQEG
jgi:DNA-binding Lrp family transcriptional regulator